jgi:hypothetical protein
LCGCVEDARAVESLELLEGEDALARRRAGSPVVVAGDQVAQCDQPLLRGLHGRVGGRKSQRRRLRERDVGCLEEVEADRPGECDAGDRSLDRPAGDEEANAIDLRERRERLDDL